MAPKDGCFLAAVPFIYLRCGELAGAGGAIVDVAAGGIRLRRGNWQGAINSFAGVDGEWRGRCLFTQVFFGGRFRLRRRIHLPGAPLLFWERCCWVGVLVAWRWAVTRGPGVSKEMQWRI